jgi:hypothetical protein
VVSYVQAFTLAATEELTKLLLNNERYAAYQDSLGNIDAGRPKIDRLTIVNDSQVADSLILD